MVQNLNINVQKYKHRIEYIDIAKGMGMLLVAWGHIMLSGWTNPFIYAFHIPLFFFISGMMFHRDRQGGFKNFLIKRIKTILLPYLTYSFITWGIWGSYNLLLHNTVESYWMPLLQTFIGQGSGGYLVHNVPLWFVTCLMVVEILYYFIDMLPEWLDVLMCIALTVLGYLMIEVWDERFELLPWNIEVACAAMIFYASGNMLIKHFRHDQLLQTCRKYKACAVVIAISLAVAVYFGSQSTGHVSMGSDLLGNNPLLFYFDAFCGTVMILIISSLLSFVGGIPLQGIKWIGENSFHVMALHNPIKGFVVVVVARGFQCSKELVENSYLYSGISFVITLIVTVVAVMMVRKLIKLICKTALKKW